MRDNVRTISNGNRTEWSPVGSVIIRVINKIGRPRRGSPICFITSMITDRIGRHEVLLPINRIYNKIRERNKRKTFQEKNSFHPEMRSKENMKKCNCPLPAHARWRVLSHNLGMTRTVQ